MKIKYMGTSDYRVLEKGENFGGQLAEPLSKRVVFSPENNHLIDSDEAGLSAEAIQLLLDLDGTIYGEAGLVEEDEDTTKTIKEFKDVTDHRMIPSSLNQTTYRGHKARVAREEVIDDDDNVVEDGDQQTAGEKKTAARAKPQGSSGGGGGGAGAGGPVGGSTDGAGGDVGGVATTGGAGTGTAR